MTAKLDLGGKLGPGSRPNLGNYLTFNTPQELSAHLREIAMLNPCLDIIETESESDSGDMGDELVLPIDADVVVDSDSFHDEELYEDSERSMPLGGTLTPPDMGLELDEISTNADPDLIGETLSLMTDEQAYDILAATLGIEMPKAGTLVPSLSIMTGPAGTTVTVHPVPGVEALYVRDDLKKIFPEEYNEAVRVHDFLGLYSGYLGKIGDIIAQRQCHFFAAESFNAACRALRALTQTEIARILNIHKSTAGRLIKGKYVSTKFGLVPLEQFFPGKGESSAAVPPKVKALKIADVLKEIPKATDEQIAEVLMQQGISISLKMVGHYRKKYLGVTKVRGKRGETKK